jgi:hypothetical protein
MLHANTVLVHGAGSQIWPLLLFTRAIVIAVVVAVVFIVTRERKEPHSSPPA